MGERLLLVFAFGSLLVLNIGTYFFPQDEIFWLAGATISFQLLRGVLSILLLAHFLIPPKQLRRKLLRSFLGITALALGLWALVATLNNQMLFLDTLSILAAAIAIGLMPLEGSPEGVKPNVRRKTWLIKFNR